MAAEGTNNANTIAAAAAFTFNEYDICDLM